jgi:diguanylate cyclase (GGDEF)-like protein
MAHVLLVDDEELIRKVYSAFLEEAQHTVVTAASVRGALAALEGERFDLVVTDLELGDGEGLEIVEHCKVRFPGLSVIIATALDTLAPAIRAAKAGAADYLIKPFPSEALQYSVMRALQTRRLLDHNEHLQKYVALVDTARALAATRDPDHALEAAVGAFSRDCGAQAVLVYQRREEMRFSLARSHNIAAQELDAICKALSPHLHATEPMFVAVPGTWRLGLVLPALDAGTVWGEIVLLFDRPPALDTQQAADYLARHLGLALANLQKLSAIDEIAYHDSLTQVFNQRYLPLALERAVTNAERLGTPLSLLFLDLDHFKQINDHHGHAAGSLLLVEFARLLERTVREGDSIVRYGGDEFVVILPEADAEGARIVAERIRERVSGEAFLARDGGPVHLTASIGVACYPDHADSIEELLHRADVAMYQGKRSSRDVVHVCNVAA